MLWTFITFLTWYSFFIFAFACGFYILLHQDLDQEADPSHDYVFFDTFGLSIVKTFTMFVGELEFGDLPIEGPGYIFLLGFVFLIVVVLMNLLNGLAVSDTGIIREEAETYAYKTQVELISYMESVMMGDPFNFLANWPNFIWLKKMPTFSIVSGGRLYRVPQIRRIFHRITGAKNMMIFHGTKVDHKETGYSVSFMPNQEQKYIYFLCGCCAPATEDDVIEDLPEVITESAKDQVVENLRVKAEEAEKTQIDDRLARIESILYKLLEKN